SSREYVASAPLRAAGPPTARPSAAPATLASLLSINGENRAAIEAVTPAIEALGDNPPADAWRYFIIRGGARLEADLWPGAEADLKKALELAPNEATTLNYLGYSWVERGLHLDEAFDLIERAVALAPQSGAVTDSLGWAHYQLGDYEKAVANLERAATLEPGDPTITDHLGDAYWRQGRRREARFQWRRALELDPAEDVRAKIETKLAQGLPPPAAEAADGPPDMKPLVDARP
ncbi:MAG: tetratricopeptide repeat protein, partial [Parvularculaceae bacterium]